MRIVQQFISDQKRERAKLVLTELKGLVASIADAEKSISGKLNRVGRLLKTIKTEALFEAYGFTSFNEWLRNNSLGIQYARGYYALKVADLIDKLKLSELEVAQTPTTKLRFAATGTTSSPATLKEMILDPKTSATKVREFVATEKGWTRTTFERFGFGVTTAEQARTVHNALRAVKANRTLTDDEAFIEICREYLRSVGQ